jgi:SnoaL-like domain
MSSLTKSQVADAFCRHRFPETYASLDDEVEWRLVGGSPIRGKPAVMAACEESAMELAGVSTSFSRFRVIEAADCAIVESEAEYRASADTSRVASCDIFDFVGDRVMSITSFTVEL